MYTLLNNREASKFDLYTPGHLVASLHYTIEETSSEILFVYCEAIEKHKASDHRRELMARATEEARNRRLTVTVSCPIASEHMSEDDLASAKHLITPHTKAGTTMPAEH